MPPVFSKLNELLEQVEHTSHPTNKGGESKGEHVLLAEQRADGKGFSYFDAGPLDELEAFLRAISPSRLQHYYEVLARGDVVRVYFDVDGDDKALVELPEVNAQVLAAFRASQPLIVDTPTATLTCAVVERARERLRSDFGVQPGVLQRVAVGHSTSPDDPQRKVSAHIVFPDVLLCVADAKALAIAVSADLPPDCSKCVDTVVYRTKGLMRLLGSCKVDHPARVKRKGDDSMPLVDFLCGDYSTGVQRPQVHAKRTESDDELVQRVNEMLPHSLSTHHRFRNHVRVNNRLMLTFDSLDAHECEHCERTHEHDNTLLVFVLVDSERRRVKAYATCRRVCDSPLRFEPAQGSLIADLATNVDDRRDAHQLPYVDDTKTKTKSKTKTKEKAKENDSDPLAQHLLTVVGDLGHAIVVDVIDWHQVQCDWHKTQQPQDRAKVFLYLRERILFDDTETPKQVFVPRSNGEEVELVAVEARLYMQEHVESVSKQLATLLRDQRLGIHASNVGVNNKESTIYRDERGRLTRNLFVQPAFKIAQIDAYVAEHVSVEHLAESRRRIDAHLHHLCDGDPLAIKFLRFFLHRLLVDADFRPNTVPILRGCRTGEGKSRFLQFLQPVFGAAYSRTQQLSFGNGYASKYMGKSVVVVDELLVDGKHAYNAFKDIVTGGNMQVKEMHRNERRVPIWIKIIATTNSLIPVRGMLPTERRLVFMQASSTKLDRQYFVRLFDEIPWQVYAYHFVHLDAADVDEVRTFVFEGCNTRATLNMRKMALAGNYTLSFVAEQYRFSQLIQNPGSPLETARARDEYSMQFGGAVLKDKVIDAYVRFTEKFVRTKRASIAAQLEEDLRGWAIEGVERECGTTLWVIAPVERVIEVWNERTGLDLTTYNL